ncbi:hypothetical protein DWW20_14950 [Ruminococcus sp. AF14-5]|nr:hypothetical protein DWW20_14950 [Ruminococcus sp. AF14-5]
MCYTLCVEEEAFSTGRPIAVHALHGLFFCKNSAREKPPAVHNLPQLQKKIRQKFAPAGKSGILYTREEERKISSIHKTDSPSCSFLSLFLSPAVFAGSGAFAFCCRQNPAYCMYKNKKRKEKIT